jgi:hypothetical protein
MTKSNCGRTLVNVIMKLVLLSTGHPWLKKKYQASFHLNLSEKEKFPFVNPYFSFCLVHVHIVKDKNSSINYTKTVASS